MASAVDLNAAIKKLDVAIGTHNLSFSAPVDWNAFRAQWATFKGKWLLWFNANNQGLLLNEPAKAQLASFEGEYDFFRAHFRDDFGGKVDEGVSIGTLVIGAIVAVVLIRAIAK